MTNNFKKGAASFYVVAFSTLILLILAVSFAVVMISETERTSNDDLAQSAYDSAMAGIEDAKLAFYNYQTCKASGENNAACTRVINIMENPAYYDCYMVGRMLGRLDIDDANEVLLEEYKTTGISGTSNNMQQAYTCVKIQTKLQDYRSTLSASNPIRVVKVKIADYVDGSGKKQKVYAKDIEKIKISWYSDTDKKHYTNVSGTSVVFPQIGTIATANPPTISVGLVQTAETFSVEDFKGVDGAKTDRAMVYLVPTDKQSVATSGVTRNHNASYSTSKNTNYITASNFAKTNDEVFQNLPYAVYCKNNTGFACSATIELPKPKGGERNDDTFMIAVALPYGKPTTDFALEFFCSDAKKCGEETVSGSDTSQAKLDGVQVRIDSTGRANDLYRRVEARLESSADSSFVSIMGPLELIKDTTAGWNEDKGLIKDYTVINAAGY